MSDTPKTTSEVIRQNAPLMIILSYCIEAFILYDTKWYYNNYVIIDCIDYIVCIMAVYDCFANKIIYKYNEFNIISGAVFVLLLPLQILGKLNYLKAEIYFQFFKTTLEVYLGFILLLLIEKLFRKQF